MIKHNRIHLIVLSLTISLGGCVGQTRTATRHQKHLAASQPATANSPQAAYEPQKAETARTSNEKSPEAPSKKDSRYDITLSQIREYQKAGTAIFIDARGPDLFQQGHLRGAINIPAGLHHFHIEHLHQTVLPDHLIVIYCASSFCEGSDTLYDYLSEQGYTNLRVYKPGWAKLSRADLDLTTE